MGMQIVGRNQQIYNNYNLGKPLLYGNSAVEKKPVSSATNNNGNEISFKGKIQCDFISGSQIAMINDFILNKFGDISEAAVREEICKLKEDYPNFNEDTFVENITAKSEFCNVKDYDKVLNYIRENNMTLVVFEDIDTSNALAYLQTKRNSKDHIKMVRSTYENLPTKIMKSAKKNPAILLTKFSIESLTKLEKNAPEQFYTIVKNANFIYPKGSINGVNAFSVTSAKEIAKKGLTPECDEKVVSDFLALCEKSVKEYATDKDVNVKFHEVRNPMSYSIGALCRRLRYRHRFFEKHDETFMPMARIMRQIQRNSGYHFYSFDETDKTFLSFRDSVFKHSTLLTPIKMNLTLKKLHDTITKYTKGKEVYYLPEFDRPKSYNFMLGSYFLINNVSKDKLVKDLSTIKPDQKVVLLDDYVGSGESMITQFEDMKKKGVKPENIILVSLATTKRGLDAVKSHTPNLITGKIVSEFNIQKTNAYLSTPFPLEKEKLKEISKRALIGGYSDGMGDFSTYYMTPNNNNNLFFSNIAPGFVISSHGIKPAFNTFDKTIKTADLSFLTEKELGEVIEIYKKANAILPECIISKIAELTPTDTNNLITVLNTFGKMKSPEIKPEIKEYLKKSLADIDTKKVDNIFVIDNIMDVCKYLNIEPPIRFVSSMLNELQNPKTKVSQDVLLHFYLRLINQLSPMEDVNKRVMDIIKDIKPQQLVKFNILEDILQIYNFHKKKPASNIEKKLYEVMENVEQKNISLELFTLILKTPHLDKSKLDKNICAKWWDTIPQQIKDGVDDVVLQFFAERGIND